MGAKEKKKRIIQSLKKELDQLNNRIEILEPMASPWMCRNMNIQWCHNCADLDCGDNLSNRRKADEQLFGNPRA